MQRNAVASMVEPKDNDYVILCDFDELLDMRYLPQIIQEVNKRGIITCKLRFTMFYFNLFVENWGGPSDYSYRMFIMTGKYFNNMKMTSDELRKKGERKQLLDDIYCIDEFCGFHHSWLGDAAMVLNKMGAYAHSFGEHLGSTEEYIAECIRKREAFFDGVMLKADSQVKLLPEVEKLRLTRSQLFLD